MSDPVEILLVGCGRMGTGHLQAIRGLPGLGGVVAGVDPSEAAREHVQREFGVERTYADLDEALAAEEAPAVFVCSPNNLHATYALKALAAGRHVFVEKPLALNMADVDRMIAEAGQRGLLLMAGQSLRFFTHIRYIKTLIDAGEIGRVRHIVHRRMSPGRGGDEQSWFARQALSGGILPGIGTHSLDVILWWLGEQAESVYAMVQNIDPHPEVDIEDEVSLVATTPSGALINVAFSFHHSLGYEWSVAGTEGTIQLSGTQGVLTLNGEVSEVPERVELPGEHSIQREFLSAIAEGRPLAQASARDIRATMALVFAAQESGRTGQKVEVAHG
jgi:predicted dehydrogenase|tara:strand:+ start:69 stop:1064 length:996 start_codon:yes stop_codon:yes gene_type:complete